MEALEGGCGWPKGDVMGGLGKGIHRPLGAVQEPKEQSEQSASMLHAGCCCSKL